MKIRLTKRQIIKALENEPATRLRAGSWTCGDLEVTVSAYGKQKGCYECAVGAVMRQSISPRSSSKIISDACDAACIGDNIRSFNTSEDGVINEGLAIVKRKNHMSALSAVFEGLWRIQDLTPAFSNEHDDAIAAIVKPKVIDFVRKHFPASVVVDIDGAKPAKDVKVVKEKVR